MALFSSIGRRVRGRRRGRRFNPERDIVAKAVGSATCTTYGRCLGRLETTTGSTSSLSSTKKFSASFNLTHYPVQFLELVVKNTPIPTAYTNNIALPYTGMQYKNPNFTGDWFSFPSVFFVWGSRWFWRYRRWYRYEHRLYIGLVAGSTPAEATYRIFLNSFWNSRYASIVASTSVPSFMSKSLTAARDFRGMLAGTSGGFTSIMRVMRGNPTAPYHYGAWYWGISGWGTTPGFIRLTVPGLDESASVIYDMR